MLRPRPTKPLPRQIGTGGVYGPQSRLRGRFLSCRHRIVQGCIDKRLRYWDIETGNSTTTWGPPTAIIQNPVDIYSVTAQTLKSIILVNVIKWALWQGRRNVWKVVICVDFCRLFKSAQRYHALRTVYGMSWETEILSVQAILIPTSVTFIKWILLLSQSKPICRPKHT